MVDSEIRDIISRFVNALTTRGIRVEKVILYGSHASGKIHAGSDLDLAIVSPDFGKDRYEERKNFYRSRGGSTQELSRSLFHQSPMKMTPGYPSFMK
jgi:hypothetical protein